MAGDVVEMRVAGHGDQRPLGHERDVLAQADHAPAGIDQQVAVAAAQMPEVAAVEFLDVRLVDPGDAVGDGGARETSRRPAMRRIAQAAARQRGGGRRRRSASPAPSQHRRRAAPGPAGSSDARPRGRGRRGRPRRRRAAPGRRPGPGSGRRRARGGPDGRCSRGRARRRPAPGRGCRRPGKAGSRDGWMLSSRSCQRATKPAVRMRMKPARQTSSMPGGVAGRRRARASKAARSAKRAVIDDDGRDAGSAGAGQAVGLGAVADHERDLGAGAG